MPLIELDPLLVDSEMNSSNDSESGQRGTEIIANLFDSPLFKLSSAFFLFIGVIAVVMNFFIFSILVQKKRKMASELLVLFNLAIDGSYGVLLVFVGILNLSNFNLSEFFQVRGINCIVSKVPPTFLVFASLFLVLIIAFNRFMAVKFPVKYKEIFKPRFVKIYIIVLLTVCAVLASIDFTICVADPMEQHGLSRGFSVFWIYAKFLLVMVAVVSMVFVYKMIADQFSRNFWSPIAKPFSFCCQPHPGTDAQMPDSIPLGTPLMRHSAMSTAHTNVVSPVVTYNQQGSNSVVSLDHAEMKRLKRFSTPDELRVPGVSMPHLSSDSCAPNPSSVSGAVDQSRVSVETTKRSPVGVAGVVPRRVRRRRRRSLQQQKHYVTTILFFVCIVFLLVSIPNSLSHLLNHVYEDSVSLQFLFNVYLLTEALYGVNFVLNPYLFSFNNSYLKERLRHVRLVRALFSITDRDNQHYLAAAAAAAPPPPPPNAVAV